MTLARIDYRPPLMTSVRDHGALGDGTTDDTAAIAAAIAAVSSSGLVYFPKGTYRTTSTITRRNGISLRGDGMGASIIAYEGSGTAIGVLTPGVRSFRGGVCDLTLSTTTGAIGIDLDSVSLAYIENVAVTGFSDEGIWLHSDVGGGCVYNRLVHVTVQSPLQPNTAVGYRIDGSSSNANVFIGCRTNLCDIGFRIEDSNDNTLDGCQAESGNTGYYLTATVLGLAGHNRMISCRAENNATYGFDIASANVTDTHIAWEWTGSNGANYHDLGTRTLYNLSLSRSAFGLVFGTGTIVSGGFGFTSSSGSLQGPTNTGLYLRGNIPDSASNVGVWIGNNPTLTAPSSRIAGFCQDTAVAHSLPVAYIRMDGAYEFVNGVLVLSGSGTPEGAVTAPVGSLFLRSDGGAGTSMYAKESGSGNTGWIGK